MEGPAVNIIGKDSNLISRNSPLALIVGVAGFLGSNLADKLLTKNIQVIGVDNFSNGKNKNLEEAVKDKRFHLINENAESLEIDPPRLDYIFIIAGSGWRVDKILELARKFSSKVVFVSSIELYDRNHDLSLNWFKNTESQIAKFAGEFKLNARVVRLGPVYGPRMYFGIDDPAIRLIQAALNGDLQKESTALEFSSRALFVDDAINLIIKSMLSGSTAQKIFDGVAEPIKVAEIKQVLLDPIWHENRGFGPSALPPWPTPNLDKTKTVLSWKPQTNLVRALKETLHYFKETGIEVPKPPSTPFKMEHSWQEKIEEFKEDLKLDKKEPLKNKRLVLKRQTIATLIILTFIAYSLVYPILGVIWNVLSFRMNLGQAAQTLERGQVEESLKNLLGARTSLVFLEELSNSFNFTLDMGIFNEQLGQKRQTIKFYNQALDGVMVSLQGANTLYEGFKIISGEQLGDLEKELESARFKLEGGHLALTEVKLDLKDSHEGLSLLKIDDNLALTAGNQIVAKLLPQVIPIKGARSYLIVFEDSGELMSTGGKISDLVRVDFEDGKLKKIDREDLNSLDKRLKPENLEPDFPTSARQIMAGRQVDGILTLDSKALQNLLSIIGPDQKKEDLAKTLNKIFFLPNLNWPQIITTFGKSFEEKHINAYFKDSKLLIFLSAEGWLGSLSRPSANSLDFLAPVETNVGGNKANSFVDRRFNLETNIDDLGRVDHTLKIGYINGGQEVYKNRMRIYFPAGTKLTRASWGEAELLKDVVSFTEYGRGGYSFYFEVTPKEQKSLILEYSTPFKLNIKTKGTKYTLDVSKQAGTDQDPFTWTLKGVKKQTVNTDLLKDRRFEVELN